VAVPVEEAQGAVGVQKRFQGGGIRSRLLGHLERRARSPEEDREDLELHRAQKRLAGPEARGNLEDRNRTTATGNGRQWPRGTTHLIHRFSLTDTIVGDGT